MKSFILPLGLALVILSVVSHRYLSLREAYKKAETDKVWYCTEYHKLKCDLENK